MVFLGSKGRLAKYICPILQKTIEEKDLKYFYDICVGGSHIIEKIHCEHKIGGDINSNLIDLYRKAINDEIQWPEDITRADWDKAKSHPEECDPWFIALVQYFASFAARGFSGGYATSSKNRNHYLERLKNFKKQLPFIKDVDYQVIDILSWGGPAQTSCIYVDPPYLNTKKYDGITMNYEKFWNKIRELSTKHYVYVSEMTAPEDFNIIWEKEVTRSIGGNLGSKASEKLFQWKNTI